VTHIRLPGAASGAIVDVLCAAYPTGRGRIVQRVSS
jgi:hypothetical protein